MPKLAYMPSRNSTAARLAILSLIFAIGVCARAEGPSLAKVSFSILFS